MTWPKMWRVMHATLLVASVLSGLAAAGSAFLFYTLYWQWRGLFNEQGRYYHAPEAVVYQDDAALFIVPTLAFALLSLGLLWAARAFRSKQAADGRTIARDARRQEKQ